MAKNYYAILGVKPEATQEQIRSAYRKQARKVHPDHSGEGCEPFQALQEAYETLCDPARRKRYDDDLARARQTQYTRPAGRGEPLRGGRCPVEPLIPDQGRGGPGRTFSGSRPRSAFDTFLGQSWDEWDAAPPSTEVDGQDFAVEIPLSREQALRGGRIQVWIPVQVRCPECRGQGSSLFFACLRCGGTGAIRGQVPVELAFASGVEDGLTESLSLRPLGLGPATLTVAFKVRGW